MAVKLVLRNQVFEVKPGMSLQHSLERAGVQPEAVLAIRNGEMVTEDEILHDGDVVKLVSVISGGSVEMPQVW